MIKTNQITPFYKHCDLKTALKQKQSKTGSSNGSKVDIHLGLSLMAPFVAKGLILFDTLKIIKAKLYMSSR